MSRRAGALLLTLGLVVACSGGGAPPERGPATPLDPASTGTIVGTVQFVGDPPPSTRLQLSGDPACSAAHTGDVDAADSLVRDGKVENAFVYIEKGLEGRVFERPKETVVVDQRGCLYAPRVIGIQTGQPIEFLNSDPTLHNVHTQPEHSSGTNFGLAQKGARRTIHIDTPEVVVRVRCDVHPWMRAYIAALDHSYFAVTGSDGAFRFERVPAGRYTITAWQERFGRRSEEVVVPAAGEGATELRFGK